MCSDDHEPRHLGIRLGTRHVTLSAVVESSIELLDRPAVGRHEHLQWSPGQARALTTSLLRGHPNRLAHSLRAGLQARRVLAAVLAEDADLFVSAALLHDIGYAPALRQTGFHSIDGATFLMTLDAPYRLAALVAQHSESRLLAEAAGVLAALSRFRREEGPVTDALAYADMTSGPTGAPMSVPDRLADIAARHAHEDPVMQAARLARVPRLMAAARRVQERASARP
jgi:hypothetical protein